MSNKATPSKRSKANRYQTWTKIPWDGNPSLNLWCWRKSFGHGHVSVGIGNFDTICYSYGAGSDDSLSGTRSRLIAYGKPDQTEEAAMAMVDRNKGKHNWRDND